MLSSKPSSKHPVDAGTPAADDETTPLTKAEVDKREPYSPGGRYVTRSRIRAALIGVAIGVVAALSQPSRPSDCLPESWALCTKGHNSAIYTVDPTNPTVECVVVHQKSIVYWGTRKYVKKTWGDRDAIIPSLLGKRDAQKSWSLGEEVAKKGLKFKYLKDGEAAFPGFADAHAHILDYGATRELNLDGSSSIEEVRERIKHYILSKPEILNDTTLWIQTSGWDQNRFPSGNYPSAADLETDELLRGRPIVLARVDYHAYWISPRALELLGDLPHQVDGGLIVRDAEGKPTGIFVDNAMALVDKAKPNWTTLEMLSYYNTTIHDALRHGLTSIHDAAAYLPSIDFFKLVADRGALPIRLNLMAHVDSDEYWGGQLERLEGYADHMLNVRSVKLFTDGALGSWGAALLEDYSDQPNNKGLMRMSDETIHEHVRRFIEDGWQVNVHCIGDRANNVVLDAFEKALANDTQKLRHRLEHAQILTQDDIKRVGRLGIIASVQPTHCTSDMSYAETRLGPERIKGAYAWQSLIRNGAYLVTGSDFPVEGINPLLGFYAAVTRLDLNGESPHGPGGWFPDERLTREQALHGMTLGAAYAGNQEDIIGSLTPGKRADLVVLDKDIMQVPPAEILNTKVKATIVDGKFFYGKL
ncbi:hypothetical protein FRC04_010299 [Tulasnella sp. 424]|nr:hypothetical protein FRC04_010299 [Tulasnella sp. 424]KAG8972681.1 hypothetical protein FRC05_009692 [Tulasnella sp. 425]